MRHVIEYKAEMTAGSLLEIKAEILGLGNKSVKTLYEMRNTRSRQLAATIEATTVFFDLRKHKAIAITDAMKAQAQKLMAARA